MRRIWEEDPVPFFQVDIFSPASVEAGNPHTPPPLKSEEPPSEDGEPLTSSSSDEDSAVWEKACETK